MLRFGDWINRKRHNRGFGIQSPSAFFFITQVLREKRPYYSYERLNGIARRCCGMTAARSRELFRIANYQQPCNSIVIESPLAACAIGIARQNIPNTIITAGEHMGQEAATAIRSCGCRHMHGNIAQLLEKSLEENGCCGILYIGECPGRQQLLDTALRYTNSRSIIIIEGIHRNDESKALWRNAIESPATIVTYDMYAYGIILFDNEKQKQNFKLKR